MNTAVRIGPQRRRLRLPAVFGLAALLLLGACSERPQVADRAARQVDQTPWSGVVAGTPTLMPLPYQVGDAASWEAHLKLRAQGQNEYASPLSLR